MTGAASSGDLEHPDELEIVPFQGPLDASVRPPGSKSITNRALVCAGLADGDSDIDGLLLADDTEAMSSCLRDLGVGLRVDRDAARARVRGVGGIPTVDGAVLDARLSGTTSRFLMPVAALGRGTIVLDGEPPLRARPMGELVDALTALGADVSPLGRAGHLPVRIEGAGLAGGELDVRGDVSSQFLSAILLAAPCMRDGVTVRVVGDLVSGPYVDMTLDVMAAFGAPGVRHDDGRIQVAPGGYRPVEHYRVEPDASAASYFFAAAAICGGRVTVEGLGVASTQGDLAFVDALESMGATVERGADETSVEVRGPLRGIEVDFSELSDTAQTLAVVATVATSPTTIDGIGFIRRKETDRIAATVAELRRCGVVAEELDDGIRIHPATPTAATVRTYDDHRMAMSFGLLGLRTPGIRIADPGCVAKTFPQFWQVLESLRPEPEHG